MFIQTSLSRFFVALSLTSFILPVVCKPNFLPVGVAQGTVPSSEVSATSWPLTLSKKGEIATLDFGHEVAGYPFMVVSSGNVGQVELKYTEQFPGLEAEFADGPYFFAQGLSNSYRVETFNITETGRYQSALLQGGQRWMSVRLLTDDSITFKKIGFVATVSTTDVGNLPSSFKCSNDLYNSIWELGARAASTACFDANTQGPIWQISPQGPYMENSRPSVSALGGGNSLYKLAFASKIDRGGIQWSMAASVSLGPGLTFSLTSMLPNSTTFVNANKTLTPPNTIILSYPYPPINQTTVDTSILGVFSVPFEVEEKTWYAIESGFDNAGYVYAKIAGKLVFNISLASVSFSGLSSSPSGSWGFGAGQDQAAYVTNVTVFSQNGIVLYTNNLTTTKSLGEYGAGSNPLPVCLDGAKRDRLVWEGDFYHTSRIIPASTAKWEHVSGTLQTLADFQSITYPIEGLLAIAPPMGYDLKYNQTLGFNAFLLDYQMLGFLAYYNYYITTGEMATVKALWPVYKRQLEVLMTFIDPSTSLSTIAGFNGLALGSATSSMLVQALRAGAEIADDLGYTHNSTAYNHAATQLSNAINKHLWNEELGVYALSISAMSDYSVAGNAFVITSGVASAERAIRCLTAVNSGLALGPGYKDNTQLDASNSSNGVSAISPNTNGFLLSAALLANNTVIAKNLLDNLWATMVTNNIYSSGASWEYVSNSDGSPGLGLFTSLAHPWGGAPTYALPEYVVGLRPLTAGYRTWTVTPMYTGFNLTYAKASIHTPYGQLTAKWSINQKGKLIVRVSAPAGTSGSIQLPGGKAIGKVNINGNTTSATTHVALAAGTSEVELDI